MSFRGPKWLLISTASGILITTALFFISVDGERSRERELALHWARQVGAQAQGIVYSARQYDVSDPVEEAVSILSQGVAPQPVRVTRWRTEAGSPMENFRFDQDEQRLIYDRILSPEDGQGVRIQVPYSFVGFLGISKRWASDLLVFFTCLLTSLGIFFGIPHFFNRPKKSERSEKHAALLEWIQQAKHLLVQLGIHVRELIRHANSIAQACANSRLAVRELRNRIHEEIEHLRNQRERMKSSELELKDLEAEVLNIVLHYRKAQDVPYEFIERVEEVYRKIRSYRGAAESNSETIGRLERRFEPWAADADLAFHSFDGVFEVTGAMDGSIKEATENLLRQAGAFQDFQRKLKSWDEEERRLQGKRSRFLFRGKKVVGGSRR